MRLARATLRLAVPALAALALGSCSDGARVAGDPAAGKRLFEAHGCGGCHALDAAGSEATTGPDLDAARPSRTRVIAQLNRPSGLMPSFADELTEAEKADLAAFVGAPEGSVEAVAGPFEPDGKRLEDCAAGDADCLEQAFGNLVYRAGPERALDELERRQRADAAVAADCHRIAHRMGAAALARYDERVAPAFVDGSPVCASGYYHGIVERAFLGQPRERLEPVARRICDDPEIEAQRFHYYQCVHGLGHGLMIHTGYDLPGSLRVCDALEDGFDRVSCSGGVFMENFNSSYGVTSRYRRASDPIYPCNRVAERHKLYCYLLVTANILQYTGGDQADTAKACMRSERRWIGTCFESFGRDVSGIAGESAGKALASCRLAPERYEGDCLYGVSREIVNSDADGERGARFCARAPRRHRTRCFEGVGSVLAALVPSPARLRSTCRRLAGGHARACLRGGGLAS